MGLADNMSARVRKAFRLSLNEIGRRGRDTIRDIVNVPVQYVGSEVIRSEPGEPPRREFKTLWKSIKYRVHARASTIDDLEIYTDYIVAGYLEYGTSNMEPRPFWWVGMRQMVDVKQMLRDLFYQNLQESDRGADFDSIFDSDDSGLD